MQTLEKTISNLIQTQFPSYYREEGPVLVAFVTEYYKWLESTNQSLYFSRNYYNLKDLDETLDSFLVYFKEKYLKNIQLTTSTNTRQLVKHALDIYRGKGTERSIDLLFKLVFGVGADIYYPGQDIFKLSDGRWKKPTYLEVSVNEKTARFANKQIRGLTTGATGFVEQVIRRSTRGKIVDVLYISAVTGIFKTNEIIVTEDDIELNRERIKVVGSLSSVLFPAAGSGSGYSVGDIVDVFGIRGRQGQIRVTGVSSVTGAVSFELINGGYAYTANAEVIISEKVLVLNGVNANTLSNRYFSFGEQVTQPKALLEYENLTGNTSILVGEEIFTYHPNNDLKSTGYVLRSTPSSNTDGTILVMITSGTDLNDDFYTSSNTISANIVAYTDLTTTADVMAVSSNAELTVSNVNGTFERNEIVYVSDGSVNTALGTVFSYFQDGPEGFLRLTNTSGVFSPNTTIIGAETSANAKITNVNISIGVHNVSNTNGFTNISNNFIIGNNGTTSSIRFIGEGSGASFQISNNLLYVETIDINTDLISDYLTVNLDDEYGFPLLPSANLSTIINDALSYTPYDIGKIRSLRLFNGGSGYSISPFVTIYEPITVPYQKRDLILTISDVTGNFSQGELITQDNVARGLIKFANTSKIFVERLNLSDNTTFKVTTNTSTAVIGFDSGTQANIVQVEIDFDSSILGLNAVVDTQTTISNGSITSAEVVDSGFGYVNNEEVTFGSGVNIATAIAKVETMGTTRGFYQLKGGFLSDQKKLFDGNYYQEYSYEIRSSITLDKYQDMLQKILHVAGTKYFSNFVYTTELDNEVKSESNISITIT